MQFLRQERGNYFQVFMRPIFPDLHDRIHAMFLEIVVQRFNERFAELVP